ncbi:armadillo-type protein [Suillus lakei]|nr:armadillo-type protein [Suillus lakei]
MPVLGLCGLPRGSRTKVIIKDQYVVEVMLDALKKHSSQPPTVTIPTASYIVTSQPQPSVSGRIESMEIKRAHEENVRKEKEKEAEEDWIRIEEEEKERIQKAEGEKERLRKEEDERLFIAMPNVGSPQLVNPKVKALLNKLTTKKFRSFSNQIIHWANKSMNEKDDRTLIQLVRLVFEHATNVPPLTEMYTLVYREMMEQISPEVQDDGIKNSDGKPIAGGQLFRKCLPNRCQEDFERGWFAKEATAAAAAVKASDNNATKTANDKKGTEESELYLEEYYAAQKEKHQGLGLIKFIGELFKLQMLTEHIMHECGKKLLGNLLDTPKAHAHMGVYFSRMKELGKSLNVSTRMQFMLQEVIELRDPRFRGPPKAGDLSAFGKITPMAMVVGPSGIFMAGKKDSKAFSQTNSSSNMFYMLSQNLEPAAEASTKALSRINSSSNMLSQNLEFAAEASTKPSRSSSRKPSIDLGHAGVLEPAAQRRKLQPLPRSVLAAEENAATSSEEELESAPTTMSQADAKKRIDEDVKEFLAVRNIEEAELVASTLESEETDARLVGDFFAQATSNGQCTLGVFRGQFMPMAECLDDITIDVPKAFDYMVIMLRGAGFAKEPERLQQIPSKLEDSNKLVSLVTWA